MKRFEFLIYRPLLDHTVAKSLQKQIKRNTGCFARYCIWLTKRNYLFVDDNLLLANLLSASCTPYAQRSEKKGTGFTLLTHNVNFDRLSRRVKSETSTQRVLSSCYRHRLLWMVRIRRPCIRQKLMRVDTFPDRLTIKRPLASTTTVKGQLIYNSLSFVAFFEELIIETVWWKSAIKRTSAPAEAAWECS